MKLRAVVEYTEGWYIGWLVDIPGVNAQEKTREELIESLRIGLEDIMTLEPELTTNSELITIEVN